MSASCMVCTCFFIFSLALHVVRMTSFSPLSCLIASWRSLFAASIFWRLASSIVPVVVGAAACAYVVGLAVIKNVLELLSFSRLRSSSKHFEKPTVLLVADPAVVGLRLEISLVTVIESCMALGGAGFGGTIGAGSVAVVRVGLRVS